MKIEINVLKVNISKWPQIKTIINLYLSSNLVVQYLDLVQVGNGYITCTYRQ